MVQYNLLTLKHLIYVLEFYKNIILKALLANWKKHFIEWPICKYYFLEKILITKCMQITTGQSLANTSAALYEWVFFPRCIYCGTTYFR